MDTKELNALKDRAYKTAVEHGFHGYNEILSLLAGDIPFHRAHRD